MSFELFASGVAVCAAFTGLFTEAIKKLLDESGKIYKSNILAAICSVVVALVAVISYVLITSTPITVPFITSCVLLVILSWLCAMVGYDKVIQTIDQLKN